MFYGEFAYEGE